MEIICATRNKNKLKEIKAIFAKLPLKLVSLEKFSGVPEVIEDGITLQDNARKKAVHVSKFLKTIAIADDSGLQIEALDGEPGVYSARFSGKSATYASNNEKVLRLLKKVPLTKRRACFRCVIAVANKGRLVGLAEGRCRGRIGLEPKGRAGFGYDPIFIPDGHKKTFSEMGIRAKNKISHRKKALMKARRLISRYILTL